MKRGRKCLTAFLLGGLVAAISIGCSSESSFAPLSSPGTQAERDGVAGPLPTAGNIQFNSRVASIDLAERKLTFSTVSYVAVAGDSCEIMRVESGVETPILFGDIQIDDSIRVCGLLLSESDVLADRIRIFAESECPDYDLSFRDTIAAIDYSSGTFTVTGRTEIIVVDESTVIWGMTRSFALSDRPDDSGNDNGKGNVYSHGQDTIYAFTDLAVGYVVAVKGNIISPDSLLAISIKVANCNLKKSVEFSAFLASVDVPSRVVTFDEVTWVGQVCPQAVLTDLLGQPLALGDFSAGDYVAVKGFPLDGDSLYICLMEKTEPPIRGDL